MPTILPKLSGILSAVAILVAAAPASSASISVSPVVLEVTSEADAATSVVVTNRSSELVHIQARIMRWTQEADRDVLGPTADVVVSPPITSVQPGQQQLVRVIRTSKAPIQGEEAYRLLVDELPSGSRRSSGSVSLVVRQALAVFFQSPSASRRPLTFAIPHGHAVPHLRATNLGSLHYRISNLTAFDAGGRGVFSRSGLAGYVLAGSSFSWPLPASAGSRLQISGQSNFGPIAASTALQ